MSGDVRVLYCGLSVLASRESSVLAQVTIRLCKDPEYLEVTAELCDSGKHMLYVHMRPHLLVKEVAGDNIKLSDLSGDEAFWAERVVPYINNRLHVQEVSGGSRCRISLDCSNDLIIPGPYGNSSSGIRTADHRRAPGEPRRQKSEPHNTVCERTLDNNRSAQPKNYADGSQVVSGEGHDRPVALKPEPQRATEHRPSIIQSMFGCMAAWTCTFEPDDVVEEIMQRYQAIDEPNNKGDSKSKQPFQSPLSELELFRFASHLRVDFRHNALHDHGRLAVPPFESARDTDDQKVLFRGLGSASIGTVGAQVLYRTARKLFEVIIYTLEGAAGLDALARLYIDFDDLLQFVNPELVEEVFHRFLEVPTWRNRHHQQHAPDGSVSLKHAALRTDAMLNVMVDYLLSHVLAFQLPSTGAIIVQITAEWGQPELKVYSHPPPTKKVRPTPVIRTEYTSQDATSPANHRKTPPSVSIVKQKRTPQQAEQRAGVLGRLAAWLGLRGRVVPAGADAMTPYSPCTTVRSSNTAGTRQSHTVHSHSHHSYYSQCCDAAGEGDGDGDGEAEADCYDGDATTIADGGDACSRGGSSTRTAAVHRRRSIPGRAAVSTATAQDAALLQNRLVAAPMAPESVPVPVVA